MAKTGGLLLGGTYADGFGLLVGVWIHDRAVSRNVARLHMEIGESRRGRR